MRGVSSASTSNPLSSSLTAQEIKVGTDPHAMLSLVSNIPTGSSSHKRGAEQPAEHASALPGGATAGTSQQDAGLAGTAAAGYLGLHSTQQPGGLPHK